MNRIEKDYEHYRIERMMHNHDKWSMRVFWGMVIFWGILAGLAVLWVYTYVYAPLSQLWN